MNGEKSTICGNDHSYPPGQYVCVRCGHAAVVTTVSGDLPEGVQPAADWWRRDLPLTVPEGTKVTRLDGMWDGVTVHTTQLNPPLTVTKAGYFEVVQKDDGSLDLVPTTKEGFPPGEVTP